VCAKKGRECQAPTLGEVFRIGRGGKSSYPVGGVALAPDDKKLCPAADYWNTICTQTLRAFTALPPDSAGQRFIFVGSRLLRLVIFTDPIQSFTLHNFGQSSHSDSPHYDDQAQLSSRRELKPVWFDRAELMKHLASQETIVIK
jgi:Penicillin amidase